MLAPVGVGPLGEAARAVGVQTRIQQDDRSCQEVFRGRVLGRGQVIPGQERSVHARGFIAVHAVAQPHDEQVVRWTAPEGRGAVALAQLFEAGEVLRARHGDQEQRATLVGVAVRQESEAWRRGREGFEIPQELIGTHVPFADFGAEHLARRRHAGVVGRIVREVVLELHLSARGSREADREEECQSHCAQHGGSRPDRDALRRGPRLARGVVHPLQRFAGDPRWSSRRVRNDDSGVGWTETLRTERQCETRACGGNHLRG